MQERGGNTYSSIEDEDEASQTQNKRNSKLKVLVRSHAMRESQSPPRSPRSPSPNAPCIKLTLSPTHSPTALACATNPLVVLSPSVSRGHSPSQCCAQANRGHSPNQCYAKALCYSPSRCQASARPPSVTGSTGSCGRGHSPACLSPTSTLVPSPSNESVSKLESSHIEAQTMRRKHCCDCIGHDCLNNNQANLVVRLSNRGKFRQQSSSQGSFDSNLTNSPCLSRDNSTEQYTDTTGIDLELFIPETLNRNAKDRALMLRIEQELVNLAKDRLRSHYKFPPMSSYQRMLVHRCAAYFGMDHNIESSGKCVVVNKTKNTRIPDVEFKEHIKEDIVFADEPLRKSILKRDSNSMEDYGFKSPDRGMENRRSKSFEEREEEYEKVRRRIFNKEMRDSGSIDDLAWNEIPWSSTDSDTSSKYRLHPPELYHRRHHNRLLKVQSEETGETMRPHVAKSYSFGGYGGSVLNRGDSVMSTHSAGARLLTKQDSGASSVSWRLSPSSSGYKSQSQMSESVTPSPTSTPCIEITEQHDTPLVWAVTDIQSVPKGSIIINPQTGQPIKNEDGSLYHYDPQNPPPLVTKIPPSPKKPSPKPSPSKKLQTRKPPIVNTRSTSPIIPYSPVSIPSSAKSGTMSSQSAVQSCQQPCLSGGGMSLGGGDIAPPSYGFYGSNFSQSQEGAMPVFQQPCLVYTSPYAMPSQNVGASFDSRLPMEGANEMAGGFYVNLQENYPPFWGQQPVNFYPTPHTPNSVRFPPSLAPQNTSCFQNYVSPVQNLQNQELPPYLSGQHLQYLTYPPTANQVYGNQFMYPQNTLYYQATAPQTPMYPPNSSTPNSCSSALSFTNQDISSLAQNIGQMTMGGMPNPQYGRQKHPAPNNKNKFVGVNYRVPSSQGSNGTNSPAATVVAPCYHNNTPGGGSGYRPPSETPPTFTQPTHYNVPSMIFRPMNQVRPTTPRTNRSSRSPTPASDYEKQRLSHQATPTLYHGMPYVVQSDPRLLSGRSQPPYRQATPPQSHQRPQSFNQTSFENRSHPSFNNKSRKPK